MIAALYVQTGVANRRQGVIQSSKTHCKRGHEFTEENTRFYKGKRNCRTCAREWTRAAREAGRKK